MFWMNFPPLIRRSLLVACLWASPVLLYGEVSDEDLRKKTEHGDAEATADVSKFSLKDIGPSVEAILSDEKTDETELAYVAARGTALFLAISKILDENPSSERGELDKNLAQGYLESSHRFFKVASFLGAKTGKSEKNITAQVSLLMETYLQEMVRSKQLNNEIMSAPILRDVKALQRVAPFVNGLDEVIEASQKVRTKEKQPNR
jgi:hypothetical protein